MWRNILKLIDEEFKNSSNFIPRVFCDLTLGCGNHTKLILDRLPQCYMVGVELDSKIVDYTSNKLMNYINEDRLVIVEDNYVCIEDLAISDLFNSPNFTPSNKKKFDFVLLDLGFNSLQLEDPEKGISFKKIHSNLDMRYDSNNDEKSKASDILNNCSELELQEIFLNYGEEKNYEAIARNVVKRRDEKRFETVEDFINVIDLTFKAGDKKYNLYTRLFQALRIAVNYEIVNLKRLMNKVFFNLEVGGIFAVISFHSLEDKIVKSTFKECETLKLGHNVIKKGERASQTELEENSKSHSAILRAFKFNPHTDPHRN